MQDKDAIFHENVKNEKMHYFYVHLLSDFENAMTGPNHNKWAKLIMHLPKKTSLGIYYSL